MLLLITCVAYLVVTFNSTILNYELQMLMNVLKVWIAVMIMQLATTLKGVTPALATLVTQEMDIVARVISFPLLIFCLYVFLSSSSATITCAHACMWVLNKQKSGTGEVCLID